MTSTIIPPAMDLSVRCAVRQGAPLLRSRFRNSVAQQKRTSFLFRHVRPMPVTPADQDQRHPEENIDYQVLEVYRSCLYRAPPLKVLLTRYVEGLGNIGDIVTVRGNYGRQTLLLKGDAVYPSEENIAYYQKIVERDTADKKLFKLSHTAVPIARQISQMVVVINMSMLNPWTISTNHIKIALRKKGVQVDDSCIILPREELTGPNLQKENLLFRVYVVINKQIVTPLLCRLHHVTPDAAKEIVVLGVEPENPSKSELKQYGIRPESIYVYPDQSLSSDKADEIWKIMLKRSEKIQTDIF